jgi:diguanylate cyclase (GGDEF)-like protein
MALLAFLSIALAFLGTEPDRRDVAQQRAAVIELTELTTQLADAVRDQEAAINQHLLARDPQSLVRYRDGIEQELRMGERMHLGLARLPEVELTLTTLSKELAAWRLTFAEPVIAAVAEGNELAINRLSREQVHEEGPDAGRIEEISAHLHEADHFLAAREDALATARNVAAAVGASLMMLAALVSLALVRRWITGPLARLIDTATKVELGVPVAFVVERDDEIGRLGHALEEMRLTLVGDAERASVLNRFTEVTTFQTDDAAVAASNLDALVLLVHPDAGVTHVLNRSKDRAVPEAVIGSAVAEVLPLNALSHCPGIVRGSIYVTSDASQPLSVHCPVYPADHGTVACVPLAHGENVGAVHLMWEQPDAFPLELRASVARIAEHAALAIGNRRLLAALQGMAATDPRTGLANSRAFDKALQDELAARRENESLAVLMLDLDHFKDFNDRFGHPAGDEALRAFADILRSCLREHDVAARYGGEEFAVLLPKVDPSGAFAVAERIRSRTDSTVMSLAPGITARISVSIGVSVAPTQTEDRVALLRLADVALYRAKELGRNQVVYLGSGAGDIPSRVPSPVPARRRRTGTRGRRSA